MLTDHIKTLTELISSYCGIQRRPAVRREAARAYHGAHINVKKMIQAIRIRQIVPIQYCVRIFMGRHTSPAPRSTVRTRRRPLSHTRNMSRI
jgi:hypothetical protein